MVGIQGTPTAQPDLNSLSFPGVDRTGPFARPIIGAKLTNTFGAPRSGGRHHEGEDIFAPEGTPIHAVAGGTVVQGFSNSLGGNVVRIQGDDGRYYYYAHLKDDSFDHLQVGQHVNAGQVIGGVGHTGDAAGTPNHLHFQVRENGEWLNPHDFLEALPELPEALGTAAPAGFGADPFAIDAGSPPSVADADQDGLIDEFEALFGTDANLTDTDHDGLSDAYEASISHTDPLAADTDKDGLTDSFETAQGSDAGHAAIPDAVRAANFGGLANLDSDADGLSDAFEQGAGTDPLKADTDQDGLSDSNEAARGSNAASMDTDSDGLTDSFEAGQGTLDDEPVAASPIGAGPVGANPLGAGPVGANPLGESPLGDSPLGQDLPDYDDYDSDGSH
jgi:hypothetical protein